MKPASGCVAVLVACLLVLPAVVAEPARLRGDPRAVERVERLLEQLGGARAWADARTLYLDYRGSRTDPDGPLTERAWRDLQEPNQRMELEGPEVDVTWAFTPRSGWAQRRAGVTTIPPERHAGALADWPFDFYTLVRRFALADPALSLEFVEPRRVVVRSGDGKDRGWWEIDANGALLRWGTTFSDGESAEYVYGPIRDYGGVRFPAWGAATDGFWRFDYVAVRLSPEPIAAELLEQPE